MYTTIKNNPTVNLIYYVEFMRRKRKPSNKKNNNYMVFVFVSGRQRPLKNWPCIRMVYERAERVEVLF